MQHGWRKQPCTRLYPTSAPVGVASQTARGLSHPDRHWHATAGTGAGRVLPTFVPVGVARWPEVREDVDVEVALQSAHKAARLGGHRNGMGGHWAGT